MKIYTKILLDKDNNLIEEKYFNYSGQISYAGIHYDFKSLRGVKAMEKKAKREKKLAERKKKRDAKMGNQNKEDDKTIPISETITLDHLTRNNK